LKLGLTGGIASGKTTVSNLFLQLGVPVIDADVIAHALVQPGQETLDLLVQTFGSDILLGFIYPLKQGLKHGYLNRNLLRQRVFADASARRQLEAILHPRIWQEMREQASQVDYPYCILSIPLLAESPPVNWLDRILVVDCLPLQQRERLAARSGLSAEEIERILAAQVSRESRLAIADDVIHNDKDVKHLEQQVLNLHPFYLQLRESSSRNR